MTSTEEESLEATNSIRRTYLQCKTRVELQNYLFNVFVEYYDLNCTCHDGTEMNFKDAVGHYQRCAYWKFTHAVNRSLDWAESKKCITCNEWQEATGVKSPAIAHTWLTVLKTEVDDLKKKIDHLVKE